MYAVIPLYPWGLVSGAPWILKYTDTQVPNIKWQSTIGLPYPLRQNSQSRGNSLSCSLSLSLYTHTHTHTHTHRQIDRQIKIHTYRIVISYLRFVTQSSVETIIVYRNIVSLHTKILNIGISYPFSSCKQVMRGGILFFSPHSFLNSSTREKG